MQVIDLSKKQSVIGNYVSEIRDIEIQKDPMRFRRNMERIGECLAFELSGSLRYRTITTQTPLGMAQVDVIDEPLVIASILRAGLVLHNGVLSVFDRAENAFVTAYRKYTSDNDFDICVDYISSPDLNGKTLIIVDPMLATGSSMELSYKALLQKGKPENIHIISTIASKTAVEYLQKNMPENTKLWVAAIDDKINEHAYIVPGLGDAGDLAFGEKSD